MTNTDKAREAERRHIIGYPERYTVDLNGIVYSDNKPVKQYTHRGYKLVSLYCPNKGRQRSIGVHRCIALAFLPNPDNKPYVCHKNDVKDDNRIENLYWGTPSDNMDDAVRNGLSIRGERHPKTELTDRDIIYIRGVYTPRHPRYGISPLARMFGVKYTTMKKIIDGQNWSHLSPIPEGYALVPIEPTGKMIAAAQSQDGEPSLPDMPIMRVYKAMIQAAKGGA